MLKVDSETLDLLNKLARQQRAESFYNLVITAADFERLSTAWGNDSARLGYPALSSALACSPRLESFVK